jgi:hypothetical protein
MSETEELLSDIPMEILTMAVSKTGKLMVKESIHGIMERSMMENGTRV